MLLERGRLAYFCPRAAALHHVTALGADATALQRHSNASTVYLDLISARPVLSEQYKQQQQQQQQQQEGATTTATAVTWSTLYSSSAFRVSPPAVGASGECATAVLIQLMIRWN
jgi:hypothetical protein